MSDTETSTVQLRYFAWVREKIGRADEVRNVPDDVVTISDLMTWLKTQGAEYQAAFANPGVIRTAIDQKHVSNDVALGNGKEIAFFPPVTGG